MVTFKTPKKSKIDGVTVAKIVHGEIRAGNSYTWNAVPMLVPPLPPSRLNFCNIIDVNYLLEVYTLSHMVCSYLKENMVDLILAFEIYNQGFRQA